MDSLREQAHKVRAEVREATDEIEAGELQVAQAVEDPRLRSRRVDKLLISIPGIGIHSIPGIVVRSGLRPTAETTRLRELTARARQRIAVCAMDEKADFRGIP